MLEELIDPENIIRSIVRKKNDRLQKIWLLFKQTQREMEKAIDRI